MALADPKPETDTARTSLYPVAVSQFQWVSNFYIEPLTIIL